MTEEELLEECRKLAAKWVYAPNVEFHRYGELMEGLLGRFGNLRRENIRLAAEVEAWETMHGNLMEMWHKETLDAEEFDGNICVHGVYVKGRCLICEEATKERRRQEQS